ncbi:MAG: hypothetical protein KUF72_17930 [Candidatus Thiodiazotropha sp. (ex Ctena orbiculata)]|nr:hypothetical protein [Candidatus Thiodiazotropha taylori]
MDNRTQTQTQVVTNGVTPFRINSIERLPTLAQDESCHIIKQYFDYLEKTLSNHESVVDVEQLREMLDEVSGFIRSNKSQLRADGYSRMLKRLNGIYSQGLRNNNDRAFTRTAVNFADILNTVSQSFPSYDYSESVGLLLHYMHKMFNYREEGWIEVFEHLISMSDSLEIMQLIKSQHLQEIQNWVEEGVDNLFALMDEQLEVIDNIDAEILLLDQELLQRRKAFHTEARKSKNELVVPITRARNKKLIQELFDRRAELINERVGKLELADLLDDNIQEFTDRLIEIRRSAMIHLVWSNPAGH